MKGLNGHAVVLLEHWDTKNQRAIRRFVAAVVKGATGATVFGKRIYVDKDNKEWRKNL